MAFEHDARRAPVIDGMEIRDAIGGVINDLDTNSDGQHELHMVFPHDVRDTYDTTFTPDCFREGWAQRLPLMCFQHNLKDPIGRVADAQSTRAGNEIRAVFSSLEDVPTARRAYSQIKDGTLQDVSFGFRKPTMVKHPTMRNVRAITKAQMIEVSPVSIGSIPGAQVTSIREETIMQEHSAAEIAQLVEAKLISVEAGQRMLADMDGFREHITIVSPEAKRIQELEAELATRAPATVTITDGSLGANGGAATAEQTRIAELEAQIRELSGTSEELTPDQIRVRELEQEIAELTGTSTPEVDTRDEGWTPPAIPDTVTASDLFGALSPSWQEALDGVRIAIAAQGEEFGGERSDELDEGILTIAGTIEAAHESADEWLRSVDVTTLPESAQQAIQLYQAAGVSAGALLDVLDTEGRAAKSQSKEPVDAAGSEDMAPTEVKCLTCGGSGESEDGKTCPQCTGSGVVALTRDDMPEGAPDNASKCPTCDGSGKIMGGKRKCPDCKGKGWLTRDDADDMDNRAAASSWSDKPWSDFKQSDYTPEQWKNACLIVDGDGSTKDMCQLPVKEPNGTYNVNGIQAAAGRINQVKSDGDSVADAAAALANLYGKMKKDVPPEVAKLTERDDAEPVLTAEEAETVRQEALAKLMKRVPAKV